MRTRVSKIWNILWLSFKDGPFSALYMLPVVASLSSALSLSAHCCRRPPHLTTPWKGARGQESSISPTLYLYKNSEGKKRPYLLICRLAKTILYRTGFESPRLCTWTRQTANLLMMCFAETPSDQLRPTESAGTREFLSRVRNRSPPYSLSSFLRSRKLGCRSVSGLARDQTRIWPKQV